MNATLKVGLAVTAISAATAIPAQHHSHSPRFLQGPPIFQKALRALNRLSYIGTRTVSFRRNGTTIHHEEIITRMGENVRIDFPEGSRQVGQVVVETIRERRHYFPDRNEIHVLPPRHEEAFERLARLAGDGHHSVSLSASPGLPVAGLRTEQLVVADKNGNVVQRLFIDPESGLILKRQLFDPVGTEQGGYEFLRVEYSPTIDPSIFAIRHNGARILTPIDLLDRVAKSGGFLPISILSTDGYQLENTSIRKMEGTEVLVESYGGRMGKRLTLFQLKTAVSPDKLREFASREKLQFVNWSSQGNTFVLVGSANAEELRRIAGPISGGTATTGR